MDQQLHDYDLFAGVYDALQTRTGQLLDGCLEAWLKRGGCSAPPLTDPDVQPAMSPQTPDQILSQPAPWVLEAGCASGRVALQLLQMGFCVVGLDRSAPLLAEAEARAFDWEEAFWETYERQNPYQTEAEAEAAIMRRLACRRYAFYQADLLANLQTSPWPVEPGSMAAIVCWTATHNHFDPQLAPLFWQQAERALAPEGVVLLDVLEPDFIHKAYPETPQVIREGRDRILCKSQFDPAKQLRQYTWIRQREGQSVQKVQGTVWGYTPNELKTLSRAAGFQKIHAEVVDPRGRRLYLIQKGPV